MEMGQEGKMLSPRMVVFITCVEDEKKLEKVFHSLHIPMFYQCQGKGTAPSELLDIFGLSGSTRLVTMGIMPRVKVRKVFEEAERHLPLRRRGGGIAITIPVTGLQSLVLQTLSEEERTAAVQKIEEKVEGDMAEMQKTSKYTAIWAAVGTGYGSDVVDAAREAGAKGGTILKGRRQNSEAIAQRFGFLQQDGQEIVFIVVPREKKAAIMSAISSSCGLKSQAHGIVVSLPIDEVMGLEE